VVTKTNNDMQLIFEIIQTIILAMIMLMVAQLTDKSNKENDLKENWKMTHQMKDVISKLSDRLRETEEKLSNFFNK
jgi:hypothetical protein